MFVYVYIEIITSMVDPPYVIRRVDWKSDLLIIYFPLALIIKVLYRYMSAY